MLKRQRGAAGMEKDKATVRIESVQTACSNKEPFKCLFIITGHTRAPVEDRLKVRDELQMFVTPSVGVGQLNKIYSRLASYDTVTYTVKKC